jgi:hypothetical protein
MKKFTRIFECNTCGKDVTLSNKNIKDIDKGKLFQENVICFDCLCKLQVEMLDKTGKIYDFQS